MALVRFAAQAFGKMPMTSVRRLISPFSRSSGLVRWIFCDQRDSPASGTGTSKPFNVTDTMQ